MRILVTGGRNYDDITAVLDALTPETSKAYASGGTVTIVHGGARGADALVASVARKFGWGEEAHPADWGTHGRAAGPIRNQHMADLGADLLLAFPGGRGTADMVRRATAAGIPVRHITKEN